jgi:hypothetical protein
VVFRVVTGLGKDHDREPDRNERGHNDHHSRPERAWFPKGAFTYGHLAAPFGWGAELGARNR